MGKRIYQGQPHRIDEKLLRVEFLTSHWVLLSENGTRDDAEYYLVEATELQVNNVNLSKAKAMLHGFGGEVDLYNVISAYESFYSSSKEFQDIVTSGFHNVKHLMDLSSFIRYSYVDCADYRGALTSALAYSKLMAPRDAPTYQWVTPALNELMNDFVLAEQSLEPESKRKFLKTYLVLRSRDLVYETESDPELMSEPKPSFKMVPLSKVYPTLESFMEAYPAIKVYVDEPASDDQVICGDVHWDDVKDRDDHLINPSYWIIDEGKDIVVGAMIRDYDSFIDTINNVVVSV